MAMFTLFADGGDQTRFIGVYDSLAEAYGFIAKERRVASMSDREGWAQTTVVDEGSQTLFVRVHEKEDDPDDWVALYTIIPTVVNSVIDYPL